MKHFFSVFDQAAGAFLDPFVASTVEVAIREFRAIVNRDGHQFNRFPEDYTLYHLGAFDPSTGEIKVQDPRSLGIAQSFLSREQISLVAEDNDG